MPIERLLSKYPMKVAIHVAERDGPIGEFVAEPNQIWFKDGQGWVSYKACENLRALLGSDYMRIPFAMVVDGEAFERRILNPCRMMHDNPSAMRFAYSVELATGPIVAPPSA
jgi:hypothetical protein